MMFALDEASPIILGYLRKKKIKQEINTTTVYIHCTQHSQHAYFLILKYPKLVYYFQQSN